MGNLGKAVFDFMIGLDVLLPYILFDSYRFNEGN